MARGISDKVTFRPYDQSQTELIPLSADEVIPKDHLVRVVNELLDSISLEPLLRRYECGGGASRYHPLMLLKVLIYGYLNNVCSSRMLAKQIRENLYFRWLAGCQQPDFRTINAFRKDRLAPIIDEVFVAMVRLLEQRGYVQLQKLYMDGTKIESRANRYTFVWKRAVEGYEQKLDSKVREFIAEAKRIAEAEDIEFGDLDLAEMGHGPISSEAIVEMATKINEVVEKLPQSSKATEVKKN